MAQIFVYSIFMVPMQTNSTDKMHIINFTNKLEMRNYPCCSHIRILELIGVGLNPAYYMNLSAYKKLLEFYFYIFFL